MSRGSTFALYRAYTKFKVPEETLKRVVWNRGALDGSGEATAGRRRGRADGLPPSFFTRYPPPARLTQGKVRFLAFAGRIRVCAIY